MKNVSLLALTLAVGTLAIAIGKESHPTVAFTQDRDELLSAAITAPSNVSYTGVVEATRMGTHNAEVDVYRLEHLAPNLTRRTYTAPSSLAGESIVARGDLLFSVDDRRHRIVEARNEAAADATLVAAEYALLRENYEVLDKGDESFDARHAIDVALVNKESHRITMLLRIDAASKVALSRQEFGPTGNLVSETRFEAIHFTAPAARDFSLPQQFSVVRDPTFGGAPEQPERAIAGAGFDARAPRSLPGGFAQVEGNLTDMRGVHTLHLLYSDGIRTISLFENVKASTLETTRTQVQSLRIGDRQAQYAEDGPNALLAWSDGALYYTLVGEVGSVDLTHLAAAISP